MDVVTIIPRRADIKVPGPTEEGYGRALKTKDGDDDDQVRSID